MQNEAKRHDDKRKQEKQNDGHKTSVHSSNTKTLMALHSNMYLFSNFHDGFF